MKNKDKHCTAYNAVLNLTLSARFGCQLHKGKHVCAIEYTPVAEIQPITEAKQYKCSITDISLMMRHCHRGHDPFGGVFSHIVLKRDGIYVQFKRKRLAYPAEA